MICLIVQCTTQVFVLFSTHKRYPRSLCIDFHYCITFPTSFVPSMLSHYRPFILQFILKTKPDRGLTQSIEVQFLVLLNNYSHPNSSSTIFSLSQLSTICQHEKEQADQNQPNWKHYNKKIQKNNSSHSGSILSDQEFQ